MKTEIHAELAMRSAEDVLARSADSALSSATRCLLLAGLRETNLHDVARSTYQRLALGRAYRDEVIGGGLKLIEMLGLDEVSSEIVQELPRFSWLLRVQFVLRKPYISRDDNAFHILDNAVRKDKPFQVPVISASGWKGAIRSAAVYRFEQLARGGKATVSELFKRRARLVRLFGNESRQLFDYLNTIMAHEDCPADEIGQRFSTLLVELGYRSAKVGGRRARLNFYPTFLPGVSAEVINPHSRETKTGRNPIIIESVPAGTHGHLRVLCVPFDCVGASVNVPELAGDFESAAAAVSLTLRLKGFGAKTSSGFGVADVHSASVEVSKGEGYREQGARSLDALSKGAHRLFNTGEQR